MLSPWRRFLPLFARRYEGYSNGPSPFPVTFLFGDGTGNFNPTTVTPTLDVGSTNPSSDTFGANPGPMYLAALDVDHDGREDVTAAWSYVACCPEQQNSGTINFINNGDGTISTANLSGGPDFSAQGSPVALTVLDLVGNGTDTVALERGKGQMNPGTGEPGGSPSISYTANAPAFSLPTNFTGGFIPGDFDRDGIDEIAVSTNSATSIVGFQVAASATATNIAVVPAGSGTPQVDASYAGDPVHISSVSTYVGLDSGIGAPTIQ